MSLHQTNIVVATSKNPKVIINSPEANPWKYITPPEVRHRAPAEPV